jgi:hypothetical protein
MSRAVEPLLHRARGGESRRCPEQVFASAPGAVAARRIEAADPAREELTRRRPFVRERPRCRKSFRMLGRGARQRTGVRERTQPILASRLVDRRDERAREVRSRRDAERPRLRRLNALCGRNACSLRLRGLWTTRRQCRQHRNARRWVHRHGARVRRAGHRQRACAQHENECNEPA